jgi:hypothetical protein
MLTKDDLEQIRAVVREEVEAEVKNAKVELQGDIVMSKVHLAKKTDELANRMKNLEITANKIQKDLKEAVNFLDNESVRVVKRINRIEAEINLPPLIE